MLLAGGTGIHLVIHLPILKSSGANTDTRVAVQLPKPQPNLTDCSYRTIVYTMFLICISQIVFKATRECVDNTRGWHS